MAKGETFDLLWLKKTLEDKTLLTKEGEKDASAVLKDKHTVYIYFSAHWCPPCRGFTPVLTDKYNDKKATDPGIEIIFVSSDRNQDGFDGYYNEMPWCALPFADKDTGKLKDAYQVSGIPKLVILKDNFVDTDGRRAVTEKGLN